MGCTLRHYGLTSTAFQLIHVTPPPRGARWPIDGQWRNGRRERETASTTSIIIASSIQCAGEYQQLPLQPCPVVPRSAIPMGRCVGYSPSRGRSLSSAPPRFVLLHVMYLSLILERVSCCRNPPLHSPYLVHVQVMFRHFSFLLDCNMCPAE